MIIITSFFFTVFHLSGQEVDYNKKNNEVRIDGVYSFKIIKHGCGFEPDCYFDIYDKDEVKVLKIVYKSFKSPVEISQSNPEGIVRYSQFIFLETEKIAEIGAVWMKEKKIAAYIAKNSLFKNGKLDEATVHEFVLMKATPYSDRIKF
jgi:hypothetical protein